MMSMFLNVLCQSSDFYSPFCGVMLESLLYNNKDIDNITIYLITDNISQYNLEKITELTKKYHRQIKIINGKDIDEMLKQNSVPLWRGSYATYYKLFVSQFIEDNIERLLYLDADIIVEGSIKELITWDMHDKILGAVFDIASENHKKNIKCPSNYYYNCGVILFDLKKWKTDACTNQILNHINTVHADYPIVDQDILNVIMADKIEPLPLKYNFCTDYLIYDSCEVVKKMHGLEFFYSDKEFNSAVENHIICHFFGALTSKPWCKHSKHPMVSQWDKYLALSPWENFVKIKDDRPLALKIQSLMYRALPHKLFCFLNNTVATFLQNKRARKRRLID